MPPKATKTRTPIMLPADDDAIVRLPTVLGVYPVSETAWYAGIADGRYPKPVKLGPRTNGWVVGKIRKLLASANERG